MLFVKQGEGVVVLEVGAGCAGGARSPAPHLPPTGLPVNPSIRANPRPMPQGLQGWLCLNLQRASHSQGTQGQIKSFRGPTTETITVPSKEKPLNYKVSTKKTNKVLISPDNAF